MNRQTLFAEQSAQAVAQLSRRAHRPFLAERELGFRLVRVVLHANLAVAAREWFQRCLEIPYELNADAGFGPLNRESARVLLDRVVHGSQPPRRDTPTVEKVVVTDLTL